MKQNLLVIVLAIFGFTTAWGTDVVFTFNTDAGLTELGITKPSAGQGTNLGSNTYTLNGVSMTCTDGGTATRVWNSSGKTTLRVYSNGGSITFTAPSGNNITKIMNGGSQAWTGSAASATITASSNLTISTLTVTYESGSTKTSV